MELTSDAHAPQSSSCGARSSACYSGVTVVSAVKMHGWPLNFLHPNVKVHGCQGLLLTLVLHGISSMAWHAWEEAHHVNHLRRLLLHRQR